MARTVEKSLTDFDEQLKIFNHLKAVMEEDGSGPDGTVYYKFKGSWSDAMVGRKFGYTEHQVMRFRQKRGLMQNPKTYATDNLTNWRKTQEDAFAKITAIDANQAHLDAEITGLKIENGRLASIIQGLRDDIKRLTSVQNEHAKSITDLEDAVTKSPKWGKLGDLKATNMPISSKPIIK